MRHKNYYTVRKLLAAGKSYEYIAAYHFERMTAARLEEAMKAHEEKDKLRRAKPRKSVFDWSRVAVCAPDKFKFVPENVLADMEQRESAPETPNSWWLGDPRTPRWMSNSNSKVSHPNYVGIISRY